MPGTEWSAFVRILATLLQIFSYLFHFGLSLFVGGIAVVGWLSGSGTFDLDMVPWWSGQTLVKWMLAAAAVGLVSVILAVVGKLRSLFALWTLVVLGVIVYGFFLSNYSYEGMDHFKSALWMTGAALAAFVGGVSQARTKTRRRA